MSRCLPAEHECTLGAVANALDDPELPVRAHAGNGADSNDHMHESGMYRELTQQTSLLIFI